VKTVLLAGGLGTRLGEETQTKPKPMVEIGHQPILWHIMKGYETFGFREFVVCLGYKGEHIKSWFSEYSNLVSDFTVNTRTGVVVRHENYQEDWDVSLVSTGVGTETGGRLLRVSHLLGDRFMMTFGDGVSDLSISDLLAFHEKHGKLATMTAVRPPARYGHVELQGDTVTTFSEKPQAREGWINGGFFVLEREVLDYVDGDSMSFQREPLERLANAGELMAYKHGGFWQCMDTLRDKDLLQDLWESGEAPWKTWS
jgi:glucose-1-phosphate cytidylyltransferase